MQDFSFNLSHQWPNQTIRFKKNFKSLIHMDHLQIAPIYIYFNNNLCPE